MALAPDEGIAEIVNTSRMVAQGPGLIADMVDYRRDGGGRTHVTIELGARIVARVVNDRFPVERYVELLRVVQGSVETCCKGVSRAETMSRRSSGGVFECVSMRTTGGRMIRDISHRSLRNIEVTRGPVNDRRG